MYDDDPTTYWITEGDEPPADGSVVLDLGEVKPVGSIRWLFAVGEMAGGMRIEVSTDRREWTLVAEPGNAPIDEWQELVLPEPVEARYVRFAFVNVGSDEQVGGLAEVEVWP